MSLTYAINYSTGELSIVGGRLVRRTGPAEVEQRVLVTLKHFYGEYFLNLPGGVPWLELILGSKDVPLINLLLRKIILGVPGVESILSFSSSFANRQLAISCQILTAQLVPVSVEFQSQELVISGGTFDGVPGPILSGGTF